MSDDNLEPLITQCPNCETRFRVSESQLQVAAGRVRCGACLTVFEGTAHLIMDGEELAPEGDTDVDALLEELEDVGERGKVSAMPDIDADDLAVVGEADIGAGEGEAVPAELAELEAQFMAELRTGSVAAPAQDTPTEQSPPHESEDAGETLDADELDAPIPEPLGVDVSEPAEASPADADAAADMGLGSDTSAPEDAAATPAEDAALSQTDATPMADIDVDAAVFEAFEDALPEESDATPAAEGTAPEEAEAGETRREPGADMVEVDAAQSEEDALDDAMLNDPSAWLESVTEETWQDVDEAAEDQTPAEVALEDPATAEQTESATPAETAEEVDPYGLDELTEPERRRSWVTLALSLLLLVSLPVQILWFQYDSWVKDPQTRPIYEFICGYVDCQLPPLADVSQISSKRSFIRAHPDRTDARIVDVLMVNNAEFAQPYPLIELTATSMQGQLIAGRRFKPSEYLQGDAKAEDLMPAKTPVHVSLEIQDPGEQAMNFEVQFR